MYPNDGLASRMSHSDRQTDNSGNGAFTDVAEKAGVALDEGSSRMAVDHTGASFGDYGGDGRLDLFVGGYIQYDFQNPPLTGTSAVHFSSCQYRGQNIMCGPRGLKDAGDHLFHNNGDGTFTDVSVKAGVSDPRVATTPSAHSSSM